MSDEVLALPDIEIKRDDLVTRMSIAELDWDIAATIYEPIDKARIAVGPDGRKIGFFILHGGSADARDLDQLCLTMSRKFGFKCVNMNYPGALYFDDPEHRWPGDTINPDGSARMPVWKRGEVITPDQYDIVEETSVRATYGTLTLARARPGTLFYYRMAAYPLAFDVAMQNLCATHFPVGEYSIYAHGHSTGGPFSHMMLQRIENVVGIAGIENSPFGVIWQKVNGNVWPCPFNDLVLRTWRDVARYAGAEALKKHGPEILMSLPVLIEDVFAEWKSITHQPQMKAEYPVHLNAVEALTESARVTAARMKLSQAETAALVKRYIDYPLPLSGPGVKHVPPIIYIITAGSRDHTKEKYFDVIAPELAKIDPPPKVRIVQFGAGIHAYSTPEEGLPRGLIPAAMTIWRDAIMAGYYLDKRG